MTFKPLTADQRFTALQSGEIDVLIRNTTWTAKRDGSEGAAFAATTFYDGQGMMVRADSKYQRLEDMGNTTICVLKGTTTETNLESQFRGRNITYTPLSFQDNDTLREAFIQGRCQGWTSDKSQLAGIRSNFPAAQGGPEGLRILDVTLSKEPLGPVVRDGDTKWFDAVNWATIATIAAEEFGLTKANVDQMKSSSTDPEVQRFLGVTPSGADPFDAGLGLPADFAYQVVKQVGNYAEIYTAHVGPETPLGLPRGVNSLWTDGGLLYAPPYR
ncbi:MAG TPA: transporter substrate-binding domain-containing protein [Actinomycetota bacterium]|nr:transporter substrate-binding domain-containing protein [Actinomycetota bacterium]